MKRVLFLILIAAAGVAGQALPGKTGPTKTVTMPVPKKTTSDVPFKPLEISSDDWGALALALDREDWPLASDLAGAQLKSLKTENEKKQLAQLRYIYLYSMTGRILALRPNQKDEFDKLWDELDLMMAGFIGKEIMMPPRPFAASCEKKLNVVCRSKSDPLTMRTTSVGREADAIHSFDYVKFQTPPDLSAFEGKTVFMGGILRKADYNDSDQTKPWALRLYINEGFLRVVIK